MQRHVSPHLITEIIYIKCSSNFVSCASCCCLILGLRSYEAKSALCPSFIRQMSPSQAMNNHSLSGGTHLVWSAASLLLFLVMAWHPQSAYQAPFYFRAWHTDALSLSASMCLSLPFPSLLFPSSFRCPSFAFPPLPC